MLNKLCDDRHIIDHNIDDNIDDGIILTRNSKISRKIKLFSKIYILAEKLNYFAKI